MSRAVNLTDLEISVVINVLETALEGWDGAPARIKAVSRAVVKLRAAERPVAPLEEK